MKKIAILLMTAAIEEFSLDVFISLMRSENGFVQDEVQIYHGNCCVDMVCDYWVKKGYTISNNDRAYVEQCLVAKRVLYTLKTDNKADEEYTAITE